MTTEFDSLSVYNSLQAIYESSPEELCTTLRSIKTPFKLVSIQQVGTRSYAYIMGDVRIKRINKKEKTNGNSNS